MTGSFRRLLRNLRKADDMARSENVNMKPVENVLTWCQDAEDACQYAMMNTGTGVWLKTAIAIIRQQYNEIQNARNDLIDATADRRSVPDEVAEHVRLTPRKR